MRGDRFDMDQDGSSSSLQEAGGRSENRCGQLAVGLHQRRVPDKGLEELRHALHNLLVFGMKISLQPQWKRDASAAEPLEAPPGKLPPSTD